MQQHLFVQPVFPMKVDGLRIVFQEQIIGMHHLIVVAKESEHTMLLVGCHL